MQKYFLNKEDFLNKMISNEDFHHIKNVMRMKINDEIIVSFEGISYLAQIVNISNVIEFIIKKEINEKNELPIEVTLIQGLPKKDKLEFIIEKTTELGIYEIIPVQMIRSIAKITEKEENKIIRLKKIAKEASEQSFRNIIPNVSDFKFGLKDINYEKYDYKFILNFGDYQNQANFFKTIFNKNEVKKICFVVGPEGGITKEEIKYLEEEQGFINISLGPRTLRCETAAICFLSILSYILEMGDLDV